MDTFTSPLVVPSFSSRGFPQERRDLKEVTRNNFRNFAGYFDALLVSAFDINFDYVRASDIPAEKTIFVDSGGYEAKEWEDDSATHLKQLPHKDEEWTAELMQRTIATLPDEQRFVYVNLDLESDVRSQIKFARAQLGRLKNAKRSFLLKEEPYNTPFALAKPILETLSELPSITADLSTFHVFGITEKSLGFSYHERLVNLQFLCAMLRKLQLNLPVHVFGALDPLTVRAYALAGAMIFDGLTWLRFAYRGNQCVYLSNDILEESDFEESFTEGRDAVFARNYLQLQQLQGELGRYVKSGDSSALALSENIRNKVQASLVRGKQSETYKRFFG